MKSLALSSGRWQRRDSSDTRPSLLPAHRLWVRMCRLWAAQLSTGRCSPTPGAPEGGNTGPVKGDSPSCLQTRPRLSCTIPVPHPQSTASVALCPSKLQLSSALLPESCLLAGYFPLIMQNQRISAPSLCSRGFHGWHGPSPGVCPSGQLLPMARSPSGALVSKVQALKRGHL